MGYIIFILIIISCSCGANQDNQKKSDFKSKFENANFNLSETSWIVNVSNNCIDTLKFTTIDKLLFYHCGLGVTFEGNYLIEQEFISIDILDYISQVDITKGKKTVLKLDLKYDNGSLYTKKADRKTNEFNHINHNTVFHKIDN